MFVFLYCTFEAVQISLSGILSFPSYLIASNIIQIVQTVIINKQLEIEDANKKLAGSSSRDLNARQVEAKDVKNVEGNQD